MPAIFVGFRGPSLRDSNYYAMSLLTDVIASGESSRLYQRLVDKEQAAIQSSLINFNLEYTGMLILLAIASPGNDLEDIEKMMNEEIQKVIEEGISDEELEKAKNITEAGFVSGKKNVLGKAQSLAKYNSYFGNPNLINTELENYLKVTKEDIKRVAKQYLGTDKRVILSYVPKK